jgi:uncharacterized protein (TIGR00730 family)
MTARVCVFGSSASTTKEIYIQESIRLGELIAERGYICVNGAGRNGIMGGVNEGCVRKKGHIRGVIHKKFSVDFGEDRRIKDLIVVDGWDLSERKTELFEESDCVIVMPGGVGTFDELWDGVCAKSLNMKNLGNKPICVVNLDGFYDGFILTMNRAYTDGVLYHPVDKYFRVETNVEDALSWCIDTLNSSKKRTNSTINEFEVVRKVDRPSSPSHNKTRSGTHVPHPEKHRHILMKNPVVTSAILVSLGFILGWSLNRKK